MIPSGESVTTNRGEKSLPTSAEEFRERRELNKYIYYLAVSEDSMITVAVPLFMIPEISLHYDNTITDCTF